MARLLKSSCALIKAYWQIILTYRGMMVIHTLRLVLLPIVLLSAWLSIEKAPGNPYSNADYLLYYLLVPIILNLTDSHNIFKFTMAVRDGSLSRDLLKPYPTVLIFVMHTLASNFVQLIFLVPGTAFCLYLFKDRLPDLPMQPQVLILFVIAIFGGFMVRMLVSGSISLLGFWIENVTTLNLVINGGVWALLGGMIVPVATFPETIRKVAGYLPYRYMLSFPIKVLSGHLSQNEISSGFMVIGIWILFFLTLSRFIWKRGLKAFTAYGG
jgi:ABC-2 type transport system permease protein